MTGKVINNNSSPNGGPSTCLWTTNHCGPNDEPFSYHTGGVNLVLADGSVRYTSENIAWQIVRGLCTQSGGEVNGEF